MADSGDKKKKAEGGGLVLIAAVLALAAYGVGRTDGSSSGLAAAIGYARNGNADAAWQALGYRAGADRHAVTTHCATVAYGQVKGRVGRCRSVRRELTTVRDRNGNAVQVAIAWISMSTRKSADDLKRLLDDDGTGSITPISGHIGTGSHYHSRQSGQLVVVAETTRAAGRPPVAMLDDIARVAAEYP